MAARRYLAKLGTTSRPIRAAASTRPDSDRLVFLEATTNAFFCFAVMRTPMNSESGLADFGRPPVLRALIAVLALGLAGFRGFGLPGLAGRFDVAAAFGFVMGCPFWQRIAGVVPAFRVTDHIDTGRPVSILFSENLRKGVGYRFDRGFNKRRRDLRDNCIAVAPQESHAAGKPINQRDKAGFNAPRFAVGEFESFAIAPRSTCRLPFADWPVALTVPAAGLRPPFGTFGVGYPASVNTCRPSNPFTGVCIKVLVPSL